MIFFWERALLSLLSSLLLLLLLSLLFVDQWSTTKCRLFL
jgi:hypothetical protein